LDPKLKKKEIARRLWLNSIMLLDKIYTVQDFGNGLLSVILLQQNLENII